MEVWRKSNDIAHASAIWSSDVRFCVSVCVVNITLVDVCLYLF